MFRSSNLSDRGGRIKNANYQDDWKMDYAWKESKKELDQFHRILNSRFEDCARQLSEDFLNCNFSDRGRNIKNANYLDDWNMDYAMCLRGDWKGIRPISSDLTFGVCRSFKVIVEYMIWFAILSIVITLLRL